MPNHDRDFRKCAFLPLVMAALLSSACTGEDASESGVDAPQVVPGGKADGDSAAIDGLAPHQLGAGYSLFRLAERRRPRLRVIAQETPVALWAWSGRWRYLGRFSGSSTVLDADGATYIAAIALGGDTQISLELLPDPRLVLRRVFDRIEDGATVAGRGATPGASMSALAQAVTLMEDDELPGDSAEARVFLSDPADAAEAIELDAQIQWDNELPGDTVAVRFQVPENIEPSLYRLHVQWAGMTSQPVEFEVTDVAMAETRDEMAGLARQRMAEFDQQDLALIGGYRPLPSGAALCSGLDNTVETIVKGDRTWLFYAFDPDEGFFQSRSAWLLVDEKARVVQKIDVNVWPKVSVALPGDPAVGADGTTCGGSAFGPDFGNFDNHRDQYFNADKITDRSHAVPRTRARVPVSPPFKRIQRRTGSPPPRAGKSYTGLVKGPCKKVTKIALLIQFDDNTAEIRENGRAIPNFDDLLRDERSLIDDLGFDGVKKLGPDDFLRDSDFGSSGLPTRHIPTKKLVARLKESIEAVVKGFNKPCCTELVVIFNSHQKYNDVKYRNRDIPIKGKPGKVARRMTKGSIPVDTLALAVSEAIRAANPKDKRCPAAELIIHSCYSGYLSGTKLTKARKNGLGIITSSSSTQTTKGRRDGDDTKYFLIEALRFCATEHPGKTLADTEMWACVVAETARLSGGKQTPRKHAPL